jgi:hypothetical protein
MEMISLKLQLLCPMGKLPAIQWAEGKELNKAGNDDRC